MTLLRELQGYANALGTIADADFRSEINEASAELYGALGGLRDTIGKVAPGVSATVSDERGGCS